MSAARLTSEPIDVATLIRDVTADNRGAVSLFLGTVRNSNEGRDVNGIDYSAYDAMAVAEMNRIVDEATQRFEDVAILLIHRTGTLRVGDVSVAIACAHAHRSPALDANRYVIEQLKRRVPIWKREHYLDGTSEWVDPSGRPAEVAQ
ncbi:MAG TPA: molybdenum cofactor biosynthesis protein MoaE [Gemmatimonadaceae bacterium]|nr:molybdenum cofactor biosynthesis protein MoaE [Gemmatimonadaceae bacterium]